MAVTLSAATMPTAGIGEFNAHRPVASSNGGIEPSAPAAVGLQPAAGQPAATGWAIAVAPLVEPDDDVAAPAAPDEVTACRGAEGPLEVPLVVAVGALVGGGAAELDEGLGDGDAGGALIVYGAEAC